MKNKLFTLSLILIILGTSCAPRKVNKTEVKESEKTEVKAITETETNVDENTKIIDTSSSDEIEIIPIDNTKPILVNGKSFFNVKIKRKKTKNNISIVKDKKTSKNEVKNVNTVSKKSKNTFNKQTKKSFNYFSLLWLLLIPIFYYLYKRFSS